MKTLKLLTVFALTAIIGFTSCQSEESITTGENPNANTSNSTAAKNFQRTSMADGSEDDFLDGNSCTKLIFPLNAVVNGQNVSLISKADLSIVAAIFAQFNDDADSVTFDFPISVQLSNYTEVVVNNQSEFDALQQECESAEAQGRDAISCIDINFPVTMLTYNVALEQTGSTVIQSEKAMFNFMSDLSNSELFSVNYPISITTKSGTSVQINGDAEFQTAISDCLAIEEEEDQAEEMAAEVEAMLTNTTFKVKTFVDTSVDKTIELKDFTVKFSNDLTLTGKNIINTTLNDVEGTYSVSSELDVFVDIAFTGNSALTILNNEFVVSSFTNTTIVLKSKTDASTTLTFEEL